jgi:hypothetical protein
MDITEIKKRKVNLEEEITKMLNNFQTETSCNIASVKINICWEYRTGHFINNTSLETVIY